MAQAKCLICKRAVEPSGSTARDDASPPSAFPFCSTRCKLVDLGAWLDGSYRIPGEPIAEPDDEVLARLTSRDGGDA
jgi:endogenous inhibitor of DNA gyrase (YacG/DUF329 family)